MKRGLAVYAVAVYLFLHLPLLVLCGPGFRAAYLTPDLLGGSKTVMVGNVIQNQFTTARDWPFGSAVSLLLMAIVTTLLMLLIRRNGEKLI